MQGCGFGHQASPVFTKILSFLNISHILLVQLSCMKKAVSACKLEGLQTDVCHAYTEHLLPIKNRILNTLAYSILAHGVGSKIAQNQLSGIRGKS